jgi:hypothetical protein
VVLSILRLVPLSEPFERRLEILLCERCIPKPELQRAVPLHYVVVQYDFEYDPKKVKRKVASDPVFLGVFDYDDRVEGVELVWSIISG